MLLLGERGLRHQRPQTGVLGLVGQLDELLLGDAEILACGLQFLADRSQATFDAGAGHVVEYTADRAPEGRSGQHGGMRLAALPLVVAALLAACADDGAAACVELREPQDPASGVHVLGEGTATYLTDPPTSGPHIAGPTPSGSLDQPLDPAIQVRLLEAGGVMIQYDEALAEADVEQLRGFGDELVVIAPSASELLDPVVITAWTWKLSCPGVDADAIGSFIAERPADAPGLD